MKARVAIDHFKAQSRRGHHTVHELRARIPEWDDMFTFGFGRNPWDRLVSCCCHALGYTTDKDPLPVEAFRSWLNDSANCLMVNLGTSVEATLGSAIDIAAPCVNYLRAEGEIRVSFVGMFEHLDDGLAYICKELGIEFHGTENIGPSARLRDYRPYYSEREHDIVTRTHAGDITEWDYVF
jgi:hypothetical protein